MRIALLNSSKIVKTNEAVLIAAAVDLQMQRHFAPAWGLAPVPVSFAADRLHIPPGSHILTILDEPDDPDALGYHTDEHGNYYGRVFVKPVVQSGGVVLYDPRDPQNVTVASVVSHEACEMAGNPYVNKWWDGPAIAQGSQYAAEVADPVEGDSYAVRVGTTNVSVSNFIFPEWTDPQTPRGTRFDYLSKLRAPFTMTKGGYMIVRRGAGAETAVYGEEYAAWRKVVKDHHASRLSRMRPADYGEPTVPEDLPIGEP
jgi:hypothetical protein